MNILMLLWKIHLCYLLYNFYNKKYLSKNIVKFITCLTPLYNVGVRHVNLAKLGVLRWTDTLLAKLTPRVPRRVPSTPPL